MRILGGVPPRAAVAFWTICTASLSLKGVAVVVGLALVLVPVPEAQDVETGVDEKDLEDVVGAAGQEIGLEGGRGAEAHQGLVGHGRVNRDRDVDRILAAAGAGGGRSAKHQRAQRT